MGGVGTSTLLGALQLVLGKVGVQTNHETDLDGLKHAWFSNVTASRVHAFAPAAILYVTGDPAAATYSHFRRGWAGAQLCKVAPDAETQLRRSYELFSLLARHGSFRAYACLVARCGVDHFRTLQHAASWALGAATLGIPLWFAPADAAAARPGVLLGLLGFPAPAAADALAKIGSALHLRPENRSWDAAAAETAGFSAARALFATLRAGLADVFEGRCVAPATGEGARGVAAQRCAAAGLPILPAEDVVGSVAIGVAARVAAAADASADAFLGDSSCVPPANGSSTPPAPTPYPPATHARIASIRGDTCRYMRVRRLPRAAAAAAAGGGGGGGQRAATTPLPGGNGSALPQQQQPQQGQQAALAVPGVPVGGPSAQTARGTPEPTARAA